MLNILLSGVGGAMGHMLQTIIGEDPACQIVAGFDINTDQDTPFPVYSDLSQCAEKADVIIDFSHYKAFDSIFSYARDTKTPIVIATTGLSEANLADIEAGSKEFPVFRTANMSLGINLLAKALRDMAGALEDGFDIEIIEKHHNKKLDSPSGTAKMLVNAINAQEKYEEVHGREGNRKRGREIGIHAIRGGTIAGEHDVIFAGDDEILEIKHTAGSKKIFAAGAVKAAAFTQTAGPGLYNMEDVLFGDK